MTVKALLKQLAREHMDALTSAMIYSSKAHEAMYRWSDIDTMMLCKQTSDENLKEAERLSMIITEIEKRVGG